MASYIVTYDLHRVRHYANLLAKLRQMAAVSPAESVWLLNYAGDAEGLLRSLRSQADVDDGLFILEIKKPADWACRETPAVAIDWMIANFGGNRI